VLNVLPLTSETRDFFDLDKFKLMKPTAVFINIGRGESVIEEDLIIAIE
jgi:phosphoglycerate dehydrogenase-like enzyme